MRIRCIWSDNQKVIDFHGPFLVLLHRSENIEFFRNVPVKKVVEDVIIPTLPNVGTALFEVRVEEMQ
jgi:hypothetical protein